MDTTPTAPRPRRRWRLWVAAAGVIAVAGVAALVVTRPFGDPGVTTAVVVFVEPGSGSAVLSYLDTLDVVGEVTFESRTQAYHQILRKYDARPPESINADSVLESYGFRLAGAVYSAEVGLLNLPGVREIVIPTPVPVADLARSSELFVFLKPDVSAADKGQVRAYLTTLRTTREVWLRTQVQAYQTFVALFPDDSELTRETPAEALPEAFIVSFVDLGDADTAIAVLRTMPAVDVAIRRGDLGSR